MDQFNIKFFDWLI